MGWVDCQPDSVKQARLLRSAGGPCAGATAGVRPRVPDQEAAYWPVLGLVPGPGVVLGVGLVVLGVSVPMPPALPPDDDSPPDMPDDEGEEGVVVSG